MAKKLVTILNSVLSQSAHIRKSAFATSNDVDDVQMIEIANRVRQEIVDFYDWPQLRRQGMITIIGSQRRYVLPSDYRSLVPDSMFKGGSNERVEIYTPEDRWYEYQFGTSPGPGVHARLIGSDIEFMGVEAGDTIHFEYVTTWAVRDDTGAVKEEFTNDSDTWLLDEQLLILGIQSHWAETKVLPQAPAWNANYMRKMSEAIGRRSGAQSIGGKPRRRDRSPYTPLWR